MKRIILGLAMMLALVVTPTVPLAGNAYAACGNPSDSKSQVLRGIGETGGNCNSNGINNVISAAVKVLSYIIGIAGIIMVVLGGFKYITSGGEAGKVANAKNTLVYALIGLVVAGLAQFLVHFVLSTTNSASVGACPRGQHYATTSGNCIRN